ncbi:MAG TPA: DoxX family protein [Candidatus Dormibacteraeota bacterium]|nr:DoxX family protein [Candidatus Dormibacteraeota bacterium]
MPLAAAGRVVLMVGAIVFHIGRREYTNIGLNAVLAALAAIVAWGRFGPYHL